MANEKKNESKAEKSHDSQSFKKTFGFDLADFSSWERFVRLMNRPTHPVSLAVFRVCYGMLMVFDTIDERGMGHAIDRWGLEEQCRFPLIHGLKPLATHWMVVLHGLMLLGSFGIMLGFMFRYSCALFAIPYWYMFILEKMRWNNHSYLFGLVSILLLFTDADRCWSLDGLIWKEKRNTHVPLWNYAIPRFQLWILYFIAGLKKFDSDWTQGYSMKLAHKMIFAPFRLVFTEEAINMFIVHTCGHAVDLFLVYLLFFDKTRNIGLLFGVMFNVMNATMFSIGMFPYMCLVTLPLFCYPEWPMYWFRKLPPRFRRFAPLDEEPQPSEHCIYTKDAIDAAKTSTYEVSSEKLETDSKPETNGISNGTKNTEQKTEKKKTFSLKYMSNKITSYHTWSTVLMIAYMSEQLFLPYSHFLTQGYNGWTNGLYGYSWDMMIHSWNVQHVKVTYLDKATGELAYIKHAAFTRKTNRWTSNADMLKQFAQCIQESLAERNITDIEIYIDVWKSMNNRFQQRVVDPRVNILTAEWHPLKKTPWLMPLMLDLSHWREHIRTLGKNLTTENFTDVVFVSDFPGLYLENYLQEEIDKANLTVLMGEVVVELLNDTEHISNTTLSVNETMGLPPGFYHKIHTISSTQSCYYFTYLDKESREFEDNVTQAIEELKTQQGVTDEKSLNVTILETDGNFTKMAKRRIGYRQQAPTMTYWKYIKKFAMYKYETFRATCTSVWYVWQVLWHGKDPEKLQNLIKYGTEDPESNRPDNDNTTQVDSDDTALDDQGTQQTNNQTDDNVNSQSNEAKSDDFVAQPQGEL